MKVYLLARTMPMVPARFSIDESTVTTARLPLSSPAEPTPAMARPTMNIGEDTARAHISDPASKMTSVDRKVVFRGKLPNAFPINGCETQLNAISPRHQGTQKRDVYFANRYILEYHPMSVMLPNLCVMSGIAYTDGSGLEQSHTLTDGSWLTGTMMEESRKTRKAAKAVAAMRSVAPSLFLLWSLDSCEPPETCFCWASLISSAMISFFSSDEAGMMVDGVGFSMAWIQSAHNTAKGRYGYHTRQLERVH